MPFGELILVVSVPTAGAVDVIMAGAVVVLVVRAVIALEVLAVLAANCLTKKIRGKIPVSGQFIDIKYESKLL